MPRGLYICTLCLIGTVLFSCEDGPRQRTQEELLVRIQEVDSIFESTVPYSPMRLRPEQIEQYLEQHEDEPEDAAAIRKFYERRDHQYAWFVNDSVSESANAFLALVSSDDTLHKAVASIRHDISRLVDKAKRAEDVMEVELMLTAKFFDFASKRYEGVIRGDLKELSWYIPRRKKDLDRLLDSLAKGKMDLSMVEPVHPQYQLLKERLKEYYDLDTVPWDTLRLKDRKKLEPGDAHAIIPGLRKRVILLGDLMKKQDTLADPLVYDDALVEAVKDLQLRHGLKDDGVIGPKVLDVLNVRPRERLRTLLVNMERTRWMPEETPEDMLLVNIPEFKLHVYEGDRLRMSMEVVVGTAANRTVIFSDTLSHIVFSPTWTIPQSITRNEILPAVKKDPKYLQKKNMKIIGGTKEEPVIQQQPGPSNSLGLVKFMFPNTYNIYLHDTPAKSLFDRDTRAFSHGCIRVSEPVRLAEYLLRNDPAWTPERIAEAMRSGKETTVNVKEKRPVLITYFTAWVDNEGTLHFRDDIYRHDEKLARELFASDDALIGAEDRGRR